jgi:AcrR family transcriptional regulator
MTGMSVINQKEDRKEALVKAAIEIFHQKGYAQARVSDIVARAGVAQGTFYLYFRSKEAVFRHICTAFMEQFSLAFAESAGIFDGSTEAEISGSMFRFIRKLLVLDLKNGAVADLIAREGIGHGGLFKEIYEDIFVHFYQLMKARVQEIIDRGMIRFTDAETASILLIGLFERTMFLFSLTGKEIDVDELARQMTAFILTGLSLKVPTSGD